jgi:prepilin-type N-terminal cleavage/methylation domain-containing protein
MILPIGSKIKPSFTLLELIVSIAIFSLGIVGIYEGFFTSLGAASYTKNYLKVQLWMEEKLWQLQDKLLRYKTLLTQKNQGSFTLGGKKFFWNFSYFLIEGTKERNLYEIVLRVRWKEGRRDIKLVRSTYVSYAEKD